MKKILIILFISIAHFQLMANDTFDSKANTSVSDQLKTLQELYKSGSLSGYEYEKEKKKILKK